MTDETSRGHGSKLLGTVAAVIASMGFLYASVSRQWAIDPAGETRERYGLRERVLCYEDHCTIKSLAQLARERSGKEPLDAAKARAEREAINAGDLRPGKEAMAELDSAQLPFGPTAPLRAFGWITAIALWIAMATLLLSAALVLRGTMFYRPMSPTTMSLLAQLVALIAGCVFVAQARALGTVGPAFWVFGPSIVVGIIAAQQLAKFRPPDPYWDNPP